MDGQDTKRIVLGKWGAKLTPRCVKIPSALCLINERQNRPQTRFSEEEEEEEDEETTISTNSRSTAPTAVML